MLPWILEQKFTASYWAFTFGASALGTAPLRLMQHGETGQVATLAPYLFAGANVVVLAVATGTLRLSYIGSFRPALLYLDDGSFRSRHYLIKSSDYKGSFPAIVLYNKPNS